MSVQLKSENKENLAVTKDNFKEVTLGLFHMYHRYISDTSNGVSMLEMEYRKDWLSQCFQFTNDVIAAGYNPITTILPLVQEHFPTMAYTPSLPNASENFKTELDDVFCINASKKHVEEGVFWFKKHN